MTELDQLRKRIIQKTQINERLSREAIKVDRIKRLREQYANHNCRFVRDLDKALEDDKPYREHPVWLTREEAEFIAIFFSTINAPIAQTICNKVKPDEI